MRTILCVAILFNVALGAVVALAEGYTFAVKNTTDSKMVKLLVSQDGKKWSFFDIGKGIAPGESATMEWDESTNDQNCNQKVKAEYADGSESEVADFDFCESDLELEF